jgi:hypothetical protein
MEIAVQGWRAYPAGWQAVRGIPGTDLPALTAEQREVARKLGISEEDYARSALAGQRTQEILSQKTERLARFLEQRIESSRLPVRINRVVLVAVEQKFTVELEIKGRPVFLRSNESLVDDFFDSGSEEAEKSLGRVLDRALLGVTA